MIEEEDGSESFWREQINKLRGPMPEVGIDPPKDEIVEVEEEKELIGGIDPEAVGNFSRLTIDVYFFMNPETRKYFMMQGQHMTDYGEMELKKAVEMVKRRQRRNKG